MAAPLINLLPNHRAESRLARARRFGGFAAASVGAAAAVVVIAHLTIGARLSVQDERNAYLRSQIDSLDKQIAEIKHLRELTQDMLTRKRAVETLQANRSLAVSLLNQVSKVPEGVYYTSVRENGDNISLTGFAQSNFHVANLIRSIANSGVFYDPKLIETRQVPDPLDGNNRVVEFNIDCKMLNVSLMAMSANAPLTAGSPGQVPAGAMVMGPGGQLVPAQSALGAPGAPGMAPGASGAAPGMPGAPGVPGGAVPMPGAPALGASALPGGLPAAGAPALPTPPALAAPTQPSAQPVTQPALPAMGPLPAAPGAQPLALPASRPAPASSVTTPNGGVLGAEAHRELDAAHRAAAIAAQPSNAMSAANAQANP
jgi:type IV pilus assembly protein PilN